MGILEKDIVEGKRHFILGKDRNIDVLLEDLEYIFKGMRPRQMSYEDFRDIRKILSRELREYRKGHITHLAKVNDAVWSEYIKESGKKIKQKGYTYIKKKDDEDK